jgi:hypothetical protein
VKHFWGYVLVSAVLVFSGIWAVADVGLKVFTPGTTISSAEVNENFAALAAELVRKQQRVTGACEEGEAIRLVNADGTVVCEAAEGPPGPARPGRWPPRSGRPSRPSRSTRSTGP